MDVRPLWLTCAGLQIGACRVPPFEVRTGEFVKLEFPRAAVLQRRAALREFGLARSEGALRVNGKLLVVEGPGGRSALLELFHRRRALEWFCWRTHVAPSDALPWLERIRIPPDAPISEMAGNPRKLLGIQAAFALGADIIAFDTEGLDPFGIQRALSTVAQQLTNSAAVYFASSDDTEWPDGNFTSVYAIEVQDPQPATY